MPLAVFVPAQLNDLSVDVALSGVARGDVLYRGASKWNNLAHGTSGQFLQTNGAGADPIWATVDLTTLVTLAPASVDRNLVQPTNDAYHALALQSFSATQTANLFEARKDDGTVQTFVGPRQEVSIHPSDDRDALTVQANLNGGLGYIINCLDELGHSVWNLYSDGQMFVQMGADDVGIVFQGFPGGVVSLARFVALDGSSNITQFTDYRQDGSIRFTLATSTGSLPSDCRIAPGFLDNTAASRKGRLTLYVSDFNAERTCLTLEADGTNPRIGVLGAPAAARTSAYTVTNPATRRSYDTTTVTLSQLAEVVGTIIADQQTFGWFG
jgi:hypothetical protein